MGVVITYRFSLRMTATQAQVSSTLVLLIVIHLAEDIDALLELLVEDLAEDLDAPVRIADNIAVINALDKKTKRLNETF